MLIINMAERLSKRRIIEFVKHGTTIVVSGAGDNPHFVEFVQGFGFSVGKVPLGAMQGELLNTYSAWEITNEVNESQSIVTGAHTVAIEQRIGKGRLVFLADSGFFYSKNIEGADHRDHKNAQFISSLTMR